MKRIHTIESIRHTLMSMANDNIIDMGDYRKKYPKEYNCIPSLFGSIDEALITFGLKRKYKRMKHSKQDAKMLKTVKDEIAFAYLNSCINNGCTYQMIADKFNVSRQRIQQLYKQLSE